MDRVFHALGDPTRRAILERLAEAPSTASALAEPLRITLAAVVQHLQLLEEAELVSSEKVGRVRTCRLNPVGFSQAERWLTARRTLMERRLDRLGDFLAQTAEKPLPRSKRDPRRRPRPTSPQKPLANKALTKRKP